MQHTTHTRLQLLFVIGLASSNGACQPAGVDPGTPFDPEWVAPMDPQGEPLEEEGELVPDEYMHEHGTPVISVTLKSTGDPEGGLVATVERAPQPGGPPINVTLTLHGDNGSETHARHLVGEVGLAAGESVEVPVSIDDLGLDLEQQLFSGRVEANAAVVADDDDAVVESATSAPLFFHAAGNDQISVYDGIAMAEHFGDYADRVAPQTKDALDISPDRIVGQAPSTPSDENASAEMGGEWEAHPMDPRSGTKTLCVKWYTQAADSSLMFRSNPSTPLSLEEDWGNGTGDDTYVNGYFRSGAYWKSRNARIRLCHVDPNLGYCPGWGAVQRVGSNGCLTWYESLSGDDYHVEVRSEAQDSYGNLWRFGSVSGCSGSSGCNDMQGTARTVVSYGVTIPSSSTKTISVTGGTQSEWNIAAHAAGSLYRLRGSLSASQINICSNSGSSSGGISTVYGGAKRACIYIGGGTQPRRKYLISHEIGHKVGYLYADDNFDSASNDQDAEYEKDGDDNDPYQTCSGGQTPNTYPASGVTDFLDDGSNQWVNDSGECYVPCSNYNLWSYEWNALALREAFAHLYATRVMNNRARDAIFVWTRGAESATWPSSAFRRLSLDDNADELSTGGRMENTCCEGGAPSGCRSDVGTIRDWTGALWNWYASYWDEVCAPGNPGTGYIDWVDVMNVFDVTLSSFTGSSHKNRAWDFFTSAVGSTGGLPGCADDVWDDQGWMFGIDN